jgi:hypothetical protein
MKIIPQGSHSDNHGEKNINIFCSRCVVMLNIEFGDIKYTPIDYSSGHLFFIVCPGCHTIISCNNILPNDWLEKLKAKYILDI